MRMHISCMSSQMLTDCNKPDSDCNKSASPDADCNKPDADCNKPDADCNKSASPDADCNKPDADCNKPDADCNNVDTSSVYKLPISKRYLSDV
jgi:hypothetical protein